MLFFYNKNNVFIKSMLDTSTVSSKSFQSFGFTLLLLERLE